MGGEKAKRYNKGKVRFELMSNNALHEIAKVYTFGAHKYTVYQDKDGKEILGKDIPFGDVSDYTIIDDGANNWRKGQDWVDCMGSVKRHIAAWEKGEDIDEDLGTLHLANAAWGLMSLLDFYKTHPECDTRLHRYLKTPKIGLDIDEVLADWVGSWVEKFGFKERPTFWNFDYNMGEHWAELEKDKEFWLSIKPKVNPKEMKFEPHCYITSRSIPIEWTVEWLKINGFPSVPVYQIINNTSKVEVAKKSGCEWFIDDRFDNFVELNNVGICCFLMDAPHNQKYDVGYKRIYNINDIIT